jgi:hypothetical protein
MEVLLAADGDARLCARRASRRAQVARVLGHLDANIARTEAAAPRGAGCLRAVVRRSRAPGWTNAPAAPRRAGCLLSGGSSSSLDDDGSSNKVVGQR